MPSVWLGRAGEGNTTALCLALPVLNQTRAYLFRFKLCPMSQPIPPDKSAGTNARPATGDNNGSPESVITLDKLVQDQAHKTIEKVAGLPVNRTVTANWPETQRRLDKVETPQLGTRLGGAHPIPEDNPELGAAVLPMIMDWQWMKRRVDSLQLIANGQTRRRLSFDFELPYNDALRYGKNSGQVMVPLTFLRKGMLINLDLEFDGVSTPSMQMSRNGNLPYQALRLLADDLSLGEHLLRALAGQQIGWNHEQATLLIKQGILDIIYDLRCHPSAEFEDVVYPVQEGHRHQLFAAFALAASHHRTHPAPHLEVEGVDLSFWVLEAGQLVPGGKVELNQSPEMTEAKSVFDSSLPVQCLSLAIVHALLDASTNPNRTDAAKQTVLERIELMCCLLSTMSLSYLFSVVVDADEVWNISGVPRRALAKLTCDAEASSFNDTKAEQDEVEGDGNIGKPNNDEAKRFRRVSEEEARLEKRTKVRLKPRAFYPYLTRPKDWAGSINLAYSTMSSASTHLEIEPPEGANLIAIYGLVNHEDDKTGKFDVPESRGYLEPNTPSCKQLAVPAGKGSVDKQKLLEEYEMRMGKRHPHGTSRPSQSRVHVYPTSPERSLEWLRVWFAPELGASPRAAAWLMILSVVTGILMFADRVFFSRVLGLSDLIAIIAAATPLLLALFGFLWFTTSTHRLAREVHATAKLHVVLCAVIAMAAMVLPLVGTLWETSSGPPKCLADGRMHPAPGHDIFIGLLLIFMFLHSAWVLEWVKRYERFCNHDYENKEYIIQSVELQGTLQREAVSVMETGAWDVEYLTDRYAWFFGGVFDMRAYVRQLQRAAEDVAGTVSVDPPATPREER